MSLSLSLCPGGNHVVKRLKKKGGGGGRNGDSRVTMSLHHGSNVTAWEYSGTSLLENTWDLDWR